MVGLFVGRVDADLSFALLHDPLHLLQNRRVMAKMVGARLDLMQKLKVFDLAIQGSFRTIRQPAVILAAHKVRRKKHYQRMKFGAMFDLTIQGSF
jgi:hypothetical protein